MSDYHEIFVLGLEPAYHVSCCYCGVDLYGRSGEHKEDCPRFNVYQKQRRIMTIPSGWKWKWIILLILVVISVILAAIGAGWTWDDGVFLG